jgi:hypothetical protein
MAKSLFFFFFNRNLFRRFSATVGCAIAARRTKKSQDLNQSNFYRGTTRHIIQIEMETFQHFYQSRMNFWDVENLQNPAKKDFADSYCCATSTKRSYGIWSNLCVITLGRETVLYIYYTLRETEKISDRISFYFVLTIHRIPLFASVSLCGTGRRRHHQFCRLVNVPSIYTALKISFPFLLQHISFHTFSSFIFPFLFAATLSPPTVRKFSLTDIQMLFMAAAGLPFLNAAR